MARLVFLGTPEAAVPTLERLSGGHDVGLVVTQPDRPQGRSKAPQPPPVKSAAQRIGITVAQPESGAELLDSLERSGDFDAGVVVAYGRILRPEVLDIPRLGYLNVHFSLLPRWRGAAPVARALMAGDEMTGVTIIRLDEGLDTGPVLTAQAVDIRDGENAGELTERLSDLGARLLVDALPGYLDSSTSPVAQTDEGATYAAKVDKRDRPLDVSGNRRNFIGKVRGLSPEPGATLQIDGSVVKVLAASTHRFGPEIGRWANVDDEVVVGVEDGGVAIRRLQPPGKRAMDGEDWLRGHRSDGGTVG